MESRKKRKSYFSNQGNDPKKRKRLTLECGMRGFLCTCNFREKDCVREAYNILNEYAEKVYGPEEKQPKGDEQKCNRDEKVTAEEQTDEVQEVSRQATEEKVQSEEEKIDEKQLDEKEIVEKEIDEKQLDEKKLDEKENDKKEIDEKEIDEKEIEQEDDDEDEDISDALNKELNELRAETGKSPMQKKFQVVDTGVNNVIFIKSTVPDTLELVTAIIKDILENKKQKTRCLLRLLPIQVACKAYLEDIRAKADILFEQYFAQEPKTFCIVFNRHSNSNLHRKDVIEDLAAIISKKNPGNKANLKNPEIAVVIEVVKAICLISIAPQYYTHKKYNLIELCNQK